MSENLKLSAGDLAKQIGSGKERRYSDDEWETLCPAHDDRKPSLVITQKGDRLLLYCRAACAQTVILDRLRSKYQIEPRQLGRTQKRELRCDDGRPRQRVAPTERRKKKGLPDGAIYAGTSQQEKPPAFLLKNNNGVWSWHDRHGRECFYTVRFDDPEGGKDIKPLTPWMIKGKVQWVRYAPPDPHPMYDLHLDDGESPVLAVEGEKTAEAAKKLITRPSEIFGGAVPWTTTTLGGSRKVHMADLEPLEGRDLFIAQDMDAAGLSYASQFLRSKAKSITLIRMPRSVLPNAKGARTEDIEPGYDLDDFRQEGWTLDHLEEIARKKYLLFRLR
ncbi:hypothetical protein [Microvirga sp. VF16]|uniref:hypothetical protein n=1 Tax=Microvirga sp. VF16 TaxID=2807101 RepID=UPI00193D7135|nr:hypothetical protein [Microvirga sp. VF16]QRM34982.1 hypothetical protein JO965_42745 [Microvirga sp. VF16]